MIVASYSVCCRLRNCVCVSYLCHGALQLDLVCFVCTNVFIKRNFSLCDAVLHIGVTSRSNDRPPMMLGMHSRSCVCKE